MEVPGDTLNNCLLYNENFWMVYQTHFILTNYLTINVLQTGEHQFELNLFTQTALKILISFDYFLTVRIKENFLTQKYNNKEHHSFNSTFVYETESYSRRYISDEEFYRIKKLSSDSTHGFVVIVWDIETLHQFLDEDYQNVIPEGRGTYSLQFISTEFRSCGLIKTQIGHILERFCVQYHVINVIAQTSCSCDNDDVFIYHPFDRVTTSHNLEEIKNNSKLIVNLLRDFNGYPLGISIFTRIPTAIRHLPKLLRNNPIYGNLSRSKGFAGLDGLVLGTLAEYLNFEVVLVGNMTEDNYGRVLPNGTAVGSLSDIVERRAVFNANERLLAYYNLDQIDFTMPYTREDICLVIPKADRVPKWKIIFNCLDPQSWFMTIFTFFICFMFWFNVGSFTNLKKASWQIFSFFMGIPTKSFPRKLHQVFFLVPCMIFSLVILGIIQGTFYTNLTSFTFYKDVNTLKEAIDLGLPIGTSLWHLIKDSNFVTKLKSKSTNPPKNLFDLIAYQKNISTIETRMRADLLIKSKYMDDDGFPLLHVVDECITTYLKANIVPRGSAFLTIFNDVLSKLFESGLTKKWHDDVIDSMVAEKVISVNKKRVRIMSFTLYDAQSAFFVILVGYVCSVLVFLCEILSKMKWEKIKCI